MTPEQHELMYDFIKKFWNFMKTTWKPVDSDPWWDKLLDDANALADRYADQDPEVFSMVKVLIVAYIQELDKRGHRNAEKADLYG